MSIPERIARDLRESAEYQNYMACKERLAADETDFKAVESYKHLKDAYMAKGGLTFDEERHLGGVYWELMLNRRAGDFLRSEKVLAELAKEVYAALAEVFGELL